MAKNVTILKVNDETNGVLVLFEDGIQSFKMSMTLPEDLTSEVDILNHVSTFWPTKVFEQKAKLPADRNVETKKLIDSEKDITLIVDNPQDNPEHVNFDPTPST